MIPARANAMLKFKNSYFKMREKLRSNSFFTQGIYFGQSLIHSNFGSFRRHVLVASKRGGKPHGVALCCRIRDEARYMEEWIEYYSYGGRRGAFSFSTRSSAERTNYREVLQPYIDRGIA